MCSKQTESGNISIFAREKLSILGRARQYSPLSVTLNETEKIMGFGSVIKDYLGLSLIDTLYKTLTFHDFFITAFPGIQKRKIKRIRKKQEKLISEYKGKSKLTVVFFLQSSSIWKYDTLYRVLEKSERFEPIVVVSPYNVHLIYDKQECFHVMRETFSFAQAQGYNTICAYDFNKNKWIDVKKTINPDIVFFTKPYKDTLPKYHIYNFTDKLTLHTPYGMLCLDIYRLSYNLPFHNLLWKFLVETEFQYNFSKQYSLCKGDNAVVVGALATEKLMDPDFHPQDVWKPQSHTKKKIIWAPHHTVDYLFNFSNFLVYCDKMLELAKKYEDTVQFAFKPHPVLKFKLINIWGKEKTEAYYKKWEEMENTQLEQGYYMDLFKTSDALIHDCASFTVEYLYTKKPTLFMVRDQQALSHWNIFGEKCFDMHYHAHDMDEIEHFITNVVIGEQDTMREKREKFFFDYLYPKDGVMPSQKIINILQSELQ